MRDSVPVWRGIWPHRGTRPCADRDPLSALAERTVRSLAIFRKSAERFPSAGASRTPVEVLSDFGTAKMGAQVWPVAPAGHGRDGTPGTPHRLRVFLCRDGNVDPGRRGKTGTRGIPC